MNKLAFIVFIIGGLAVYFWPNPQTATAVPQDNLQITISISPLFGLHSDWDRKVAITHNGRRMSKDLFEDTGWWRGSNLYRHTSGAYIVHEGQGGCFGFTLAPFAFDRDLQKSCVKDRSLTTVPDGYSQYYRDLVYIGHFYETYRDKDGVRIRYADASQAPELELPYGP